MTDSDDSRARHRRLVRLGPRKVAAGAGMFVVVAAAVFAQAAWGVSGLVAVLLIVQVLTALALGAALAQLHRRLPHTVVKVQEKPLEAAEQRITGRVRRELARQREEVQEWQDAIAVDLRERHENVQALVQATGVDLLKAQRGHLARIEESLDQAGERMRRSLGNERRQYEALLNIHHLLHIRDTLPGFWGYSAAPDFQALLLSLVLVERPAKVVECGSGATTVLLAYALEHTGRGRLVSLEHDPEYHRKTREVLDRHQLTAWVDLYLAPLRTYQLGDESYDWYDLEEVPSSARFDLVVVDGPPGWLGQDARYPTLPVLADRLAPDATIVVDDHARDDEQRIVERWLAAEPSLTLEVFPHERGTAVLRRQSTST